jgi:protein-disulfide isomerase
VGIERQLERTLDEDTIVIKKSWLINAGVAVVSFALGGLAGYLVATSAFGGDAGQAGEANPQSASSYGQAAQPPARLDDVSADDDPFIGPADAPVTIVEFSDFR